MQERLGTHDVHAADNASAAEQSLHSLKVGEPSSWAEESKPFQAAKDDSTVNPNEQLYSLDPQKLTEKLELNKEVNDKAISHQPSVEETEIYKMANQNAMRENDYIMMEEEPSTAAEEVHPHETASESMPNQASSAWALDESLRAMGKSQPYKANERFRVIKVKLKTPKAEEARRGDQHELELAKAAEAFKEELRAEREEKRAEMGRLVAVGQNKVINSTESKGLLEVTSFASLGSSHVTERRDYSNPFLVMRPATTPTVATEEWTRPWRQEVRLDNGVWLCSNCSGFLDRDATIADRDVLLAAWAALGVWHPFERVPSEPIRRRSCAYCRRQQFCYSYQKFPTDMEIDE